MKILLEMRPALDGHAGIPQEARLLFRGLSTLPDLEVQGLLQSSNRVISRGLPAQEQAQRRLSNDRRVHMQSRVVISLKTTEHKRLSERLSEKWRNLVAPSAMIGRRLLGRSELRGPADYRVFPNRAAVPPELAAHPDAFIERFLPETENGLYHTRSMVFVGPARTCQLLRAHEPVVRVGNAIGIEECEPHPDMVRLSREMGYDYGKFDYVMHDGVPVLIDANKTTGSADMVRFPVIGAMRERRARGLYQWLAERG